MSDETLPSSRPLSRRSVLKGGGAAVAGVLGGSVVAPGRSLAAAASPAQAGAANPPTVGIIGGGMAGIETAWLLDGVCQTTIIESNNYIGGHVLSQTVDINGESLAVDLGAQYFGPNNYPNFWQLIGDPDNASYPSKNVLGLTPPVQCDMGITYFNVGETDYPYFCSTYPAGGGFNAIDPLTWPGAIPYVQATLAFFLFFSAAQLAFQGDYAYEGNVLNPVHLGAGPWDQANYDYVHSVLDPASLLIGDDQADAFLLPLLAALNGDTTSSNNTGAARGGVSFLVRGAPVWPVPDIPALVVPPFLGLPAVSPIPYYNAVGGLGTVADAMLQELTTCYPPGGAPAPGGGGNPVYNTKVTGITQLANGQWQVSTATGPASAGPGSPSSWGPGPQYTFDQLVFACPPYVTGPLVAGAGSLGAQLADILSPANFPYFTDTVAIHTDPVYMFPNQRYWTAYNAQNWTGPDAPDGGACGASMYYGGLYGSSLPQYQGVSLFKSWISNRPVQPDPASILYQETYQHPNITYATVAAQEQLSGYQGQQNLWFAGSYTYDVDSQENALVSAIKIAQRLAPTSPNMQRLNPPPPSQTFNPWQPGL
jgi:uncharacterized protein